MSAEILHYVETTAIDKALTQFMQQGVDMSTFDWVKQDVHVNKQWIVDMAFMESQKNNGQVTSSVIDNIARQAVVNSAQRCAQVRGGSHGFQQPQQPMYQQQQNIYGNNPYQQPMQQRQGPMNPYGNASMPADLGTMNQSPYQHDNCVQNPYGTPPQQTPVNNINYDQNHQVEEPEPHVTPTPRKNKKMKKNEHLLQPINSLDYDTDTIERRNSITVDIPGCRSLHRFTEYTFADNEKATYSELTLEKPVYSFEEGFDKIYTNIDKGFNTGFYINFLNIRTAKIIHEDHDQVCKKMNKFNVADGRYFSNVLVEVLRQILSLEYNSLAKSDAERLIVETFNTIAQNCIFVEDMIENDDYWERIPSCDDLDDIMFFFMTEHDMREEDEDLYNSLLLLVRHPKYNDYLEIVAKQVFNRFKSEIKILGNDDLITIINHPELNIMTNDGKYARDIKSVEDFEGSSFKDLVSDSVYTDLVGVYHTNIESQFFNSIDIGETKTMEEADSFFSYFIVTLKSTRTTSNADIDTLYGLLCVEFILYESEEGQKRFKVKKSLDGKFCFERIA